MVPQLPAVNLHPCTVEVLERRLSALLDAAAIAQLHLGYAAIDLAIHFLDIPHTERIHTPVTYFSLLFRLEA